MNDVARPTYHDVHVTTASIRRTSIFDLPFGYELTCTRVGGWQLWGPHDERSARDEGLRAARQFLTGPKLVAGEYDKGLRIDVDGHVICDSLTRRAPKDKP